MDAINMRQLRDTRKLKSLLKSGKTVELRERDRPIARIVPIDQAPARKAEWPDFETRLKKIFGDRVLPAVDEFLRDRHGRY